MPCAIDPARCPDHIHNPPPTYDPLSSTLPRSVLCLCSGGSHIHNPPYIPWCLSVLCLCSGGSHPYPLILLPPLCTCICLLLIMRATELSLLRSLLASKIRNRCSMRSMPRLGELPPTTTSP